MNPAADGTDEASLPSAAASQPTNRRGHRRPPSEGERLFLLGTGLVGLLLLAVAACLTPAQEGHGTHRQLGLPPCTVRVLLGIPCPSCGMTTAWTHFAHGDPAAAARTNFTGLLLAMTALLYAPWALYVAIRRPAVWSRRLEGAYVALLLTLALIGMVEYGLRLSGLVGAVPAAKQQPEIGANHGSEGI